MSSRPDALAARRFSEPAIVAFALVLVVGIHALVYGRYLPYVEGRIGHDYSYFFPHLLAGAYWFEHNGLFSIPWFTPAFGAGLPFYAHPASGYVSFPQAAMIVAGPIFAVRATLVVFAALGFLGTYALLRRAFACSLAASLFGATLFAWNGFFTARMMSGHLGFHSQMLVPLAAWWLVRPVVPEKRASRLVIDALLAGLVFAYMFQSGNFYGMVPAVLSCAAIALVAALRNASIAQFALRLGAASCIALALCLAKLDAALAFVAACPRSAYPLPGAINVFAALWLAFQSVFLFSSASIGHALMENDPWRMEQHEWDFVVTWVPLAVMLAAAFVTRRVLLGELKQRRIKVLLGVLCAVLLVPIAVNTYGESWSAFLKRVPLVQSSSTLVRWFVAYVPVVCVLAALALDRLQLTPRKRETLALAACALMMLTRVLESREYYERQLYGSARIEEAARKLRETHHVPKIDRVQFEHDAAGTFSRHGDSDDILTEGVSPAACYEPMFGYRLEWFPFRTIHTGGPRDRTGDDYNFKNPAGYLFPEENGVAPGGHFHVGQEHELDALLDYRPFEYAKPARQKIAEVANVIAIALVALVLAIAGVNRLRK